MIGEAYLPAWIALFIGLYSFAASVGEIREPGLWARMLREIQASRALRFLTGLAAILTGALIFLANPWAPGDWISILIAVIGGLAVLEGMLILGFGDWYIRFARKLLSGHSFTWALAAMLIGLALVALGVANVSRPL